MQRTTTVSRDLIDEFLEQKNLALVGVRRDGERGFGNAVRKELAEKGYKLYIVHPEADHIGDQPCAHSLAEVADKVGGAIFVTPPEQTLKLVDEAAAAGIRRIWMQQGSESVAAVERCSELGIAVVHGECILMFSEPTAWLHRAHRWMRGAFGHLPEHPDAPHDRTSLERKLMREVAAAALPTGPAQPETVTDSNLVGLPSSVQRYFRFMNVVGRPRDWSFTMHFEGKFLFDGAWVPCECAQYNSSLAVARIFHMRLRVKGIVPTYVRDTYLRGRGHMVGKVLDTVSLVDDSSERIAIGECVTFLNDAVLMAPTMLLSPYVTFEDAGSSAFDVVLEDSGRAVRARVFIDNEGAVTDFLTADRYYAPPRSTNPPARAEWRTPVEGWQEYQGRKLPTKARAIWMLPTGRLTYAEFPFDATCFQSNVSPGCLEK